MRNYSIEDATDWPVLDLTGPQYPTYTGGMQMSSLGASCHSITIKG